MIKRGNKVSTYESAREENLWLRWKQNSETKIRPLETHRRAHANARTNAARKEREKEYEREESAASCEQKREREGEKKSRRKGTKSAYFW